jgi:hypothetical protein
MFIEYRSLFDLKEYSHVVIGTDDVQPKGSKYIIYLGEQPVTCGEPAHEHDMLKLHKKVWRTIFEE